MKNQYLTVEQLSKACENHKYILARFSSGHLMGLNTKVASIAKKRKEYSLKDETSFVSYIPCDFHTYITYKHSFFTKK